MRIRETKLGDYKEIHDLLKIEDMTWNYFTKYNFSKMLKRNKSYYFVAEDKGKIIGNIFATDDGGYCGYIYKVVVDKDCRRKGIAKKLIKQVLKKLNKNKILWVYCHIRKKNKTSINLFQKFGFREKTRCYWFDVYKGK